MSGTSHSATLKQVSRATLYNQHNWWIPQKRWLWAYIILQLVWGKRIIKLCISGHYVRALSAPPWILLFNISNILFYGNLSSRLGRWNHQFGFSSWNCNPAFTKVAAWSVLSHGRRGKSPNVTMMQFTHQLRAAVTGPSVRLCTDSRTNWFETKTRFLIWHCNKTQSIFGHFI